MYSSNILEEASIVLDKMLPIEENTEYYPELVPVFEDYEHATNIIRIEDLVEYATSNNITDGTDAITSICEANKVLPETVSLSIDESNAFIDLDMLLTLKSFEEAGFNIFINPISSNDLNFIYTEAVLDSINEYNKNIIIESYIYDNFSLIKKSLKESNTNLDNYLNSAKNKLASESISSEWAGKKFSSLRKIKYSLLDNLENSNSELEKKSISKKIDIVDNILNELKKSLKVNK